MYQGLKSQINLRFREEKPAAELIGRPPLRNTGIVKKVESDIRGCGKPTVHRILKSDLKLSKASARWVPRLLSVDDCEHSPVGYNCENCPTSFII